MMTDKIAAGSPIDDMLKAEALNWLEALRASAGQARTFALEEAPELLREMVTLGRFESTIWFVGPFVMFLFGLFMLVKFLNWMSKEDTKPDDAGPVGIALLLYLGLTLVLTMASFHTFATAWFAPRIYILEQLAGLAGQAAGR